MGNHVGGGAEEGGGEGLEKDAAEMRGPGAGAAGTDFVCVGGAEDGVEVVAGLGGADAAEWDGEFFIQF